MKLSILIPTLPEPYRIQHLKRLTNVLNPQVAKFPGQVEIRIHDAGRSMTIGRKRNEMVRNCDGEYFCFVDDDDMVPVYYVDEIMKALQSGPDVVTFIGYMTTNGANRRNFTIKLGSDYVERGGHYYRFPNHLCVFRKSLVQHIQFPDIRAQEDYQWSKQIHDRKIIKNEVHINKDMYIYDFQSNKPKLIPR